MSAKRILIKSALAGALGALLAAVGFSFPCWQYFAILTIYVVGAYS